MRKLLLSLTLLVAAVAWAHDNADNRYPYRGMHLDVSRHFFSVDFVKRYLDILAMHDVNYFHWHLTDNQGWRLEITEYPELTRGVPHYSHADVREVVAYAKTLGIEVVPEIDLPGHMAGAVRAYPWLACAGERQEQSDVLCIGQEKTYDFLRSVLKEVAELFPCELVHVGGDEVGTGRWSRCPHCHDKQQSYCMLRVAEMLRELGKKYIMWDDVLDGGMESLDGGYIMIWRDAESAKKVYARGGKSIMSPARYCYFDYFQTANIDNEPRAFGNNLPIERVYSFLPTAGLTPAEAASVVGVQGNVWTEHISRPKHVEYMILPRLAALAEVQSGRNATRSFHDFMPELEARMKEYKARGYNYSRHLYDVSIKVKRNVEERCVEAFLTSADGTIVEHQRITRTDTIVAAPAVAPGDKTEWTLEGKTYPYYAQNMRHFTFAKSTFCPMELDDTFLDKPRYAFDGAVTLNDGIRGEKNFSNGDWLGFKGGPAIVTFDLRNKQRVSRVALSCMVDMEAWISNVGRITVLTSADGKTFSEAARQEYPIETRLERKEPEEYSLSFKARKARYVRVIVEPAKDFPETHDGHGTAPYLFLDEIMVN